MIRIGTRASKLAIAQAEIISKVLQGTFGYDTEIVPLSSKGDHDQISKLTTFRGQGVFTSHLEAALLKNTVDIAVHSLKDLPVNVREDLPVRIYHNRHSPGDSLLIKTDVVKSSSPLAFTRAIKFATGSPRRQAQFIHSYPDAIPIDIRGNVHTRVKKLQTSAIDGLIMASAVFDRIDLKLPEDVMRIDLDPLKYPPAPGQAVIAVQCRAGEFEELASLNHVDTQLAAEGERELLFHMGGGCDLSFGAYFYKENTVWNLVASYAPPRWYPGQDLQMSQFHYQGQSRDDVLTRFKADVQPVEPLGVVNQSHNQLAGKTIIITRDANGASSYKSHFNTCGLISVPVPISDYEINWDQLHNTDLLEAWRDSNWVVISSKKAVTFFSMLSKLHPHPTKVAAVGSKTAAALRAEDFPVHIVADGSMASLQGYLHDARKDEDQVVYFHGEKYTEYPSSDTKGFPVYSVSYRSNIKLPFKPDYLLVFSKIAATTLLDRLGEACTGTWIAIGPTTASAFEGTSTPLLIASNPSPDGVLNTLLEAET